MRLIILLLIVSGAALSGCKKYNLKQPCHLSFKWKMSNGSGSSPATVEEAFMYASSISVDGVREEGEDISLEQTIPNDKIVVGSSSPVSVKMDIPMGDYTSLNAGISFFDAEMNNFGLSGHTLYYGNTVKFNVEWEDMETALFKATEKLEFKKKKDYSLNLTLDSQKLMEGITQEMWNGAVVSLEPTGPTIYIRETKNHHFHDIITANLAKALFIQID